MATSVGTAVLFEFRRDGKTTQHIVTPESANPANGQIVPVNLVTRQLSATEPRRSWKIREASVVSKGDTYGHIVPISDPGEAMREGASRAQFLITFFEGLSLGGWKLYKTPVAIEMTGDDVAEIAEHKTPQALIRRMVNARLEAGFDKSFWAE